MLNETKLNQTKPPKIKDFTLIASRSRTLIKLQGGGVAIYVRSNLSGCDISPDHDDIAAIEIDIPSQGKLALISYYVPPNGDDLDTALLETLLMSHPRAIIAGDLNCKTSILAADLAPTMLVTGYSLGLNKMTWSF